MKAAFRFAPAPNLVKEIVEEEPVRDIDRIVPAETLVQLP